MVLAGSGGIADLLRELGVGNVQDAIAAVRQLKGDRDVDKARIAELERTAEARRPAKGRSPAEWRFRILGWDWIEMVISPRELPAGKTIRALRIFVPLEDQPDGPGYWDITRKKAIAMIEPLLPHFAGTQTYLTLRQHGAGARSYDSLAVSPPSTP